MRKTLGVFGVFALVAAAACVRTVDIETEKAAVRSVIDRHILANEREDIELYLKCFAHDDGMVHIGMGNERWVGIEDVKRHVADGYGLCDDMDIELSNPVINIHGSGTVAWFSCYWDLKATCQNVSLTIDKMRFTGVMEKREGRWVYVQTHASVPGNAAPEQEWAVPEKQ